MMRVWNNLHQVEKPINLKVFEYKQTKEPEMIYC
jgi:hypothetical protein